MARQNSTFEFNSFVRGLITEAGPLTFPENASLSEVNWVVGKDGSRRRRDGMNFEEAHAIVTTNQTMPPSKRVSASTFLWENAGGKADLRIAVVHIQNQISFFRRGENSLSEGLIYQSELNTPADGNPVGYASVDGRLIVVNGDGNIYIYSIDLNDNITQSRERLEIRDLFGVEDFNGGYNLLDGNWINLRPREFSGRHIYNLRNQTWAIPRLTHDEPDTFYDPILLFRKTVEPEFEGQLENHFGFDGFLTNHNRPYWVIQHPVTGQEVPFDSEAPPPVLSNRIMRVLLVSSFAKQNPITIQGVNFKKVPSSFLIYENPLVGWMWSGYPNYATRYPSNADSVIPFLFANPQIEQNLHTGRFYARDAYRTPPGTSRAPTGHFIIDALKRGQSRYTAMNILHDKHPSLLFRTGWDWPQDETPGGARAAASYAGRVFYAGFGGGVIDGDMQSPNMESYVLFSKLVRSQSDITKCYQQGDPTSTEEPDILDTDGGFIKVDGAYGIKSLVNIGGALVVLAANGVWTIQGGSGYGFSATNYLVQKVSDFGVVGTQTSVVVEGVLLFWGTDGIYQVAQSENRWNVQSITANTIQSFYLDIPDEDKRDAKGFFDSYEGRVRWLYSTLIEEGEVTKELVLDMASGAFLPQEINRLAGGYPAAVGMIQVEPYQLTTVTEPVTVNGEIVTVDGEPVTMTVDRRRAATREIAYLTLVSGNPIQFTFSTYNDRAFVDWRDADGVGVDSPAHLLTGYISAGDFQRYKQVQYLTTHFERTETEFVLDGGDVVSVNESSCIVQAQWEWTNSPNSNRWGREFQAYRYVRHYIPDQAGDAYDTGFRTIQTKHKIRGKGRVVSFLFRTEPGKDCHLYGWSMILGITGNV